MSNEKGGRLSVSSVDMKSGRCCQEQHGYRSERMVPEKANDKGLIVECSTHEMTMFDLFGK